MTTLQGTSIYESVSLRLFAWCSQYNIIMGSWQTTPPFDHDQKKPYAQSEATNSLGNKWHPYARTIERQNSKRIGIRLPTHVGTWKPFGGCHKCIQPSLSPRGMNANPYTYRKRKRPLFEWFHSFYSPSS
jgi:hypothetical protein